MSLGKTETIECSVCRTIGGLPAVTPCQTPRHLQGVESPRLRVCGA